MYLCERMLTEMDVKALVDKRRMNSRDTGTVKSKRTTKTGKSAIKSKELKDLEDNERFESDIRSAAALQGAYHNLSKEAHKGQINRQSGSVVVEAKTQDPYEEILKQAINERKRTTKMRSVFNKMDVEGKGKISAEQFIEKYYLVDSTLSRDMVHKIFLEAGKVPLVFDFVLFIVSITQISVSSLCRTDHDNAGYIDYEKFLLIADMPALQRLRALQSINRPRSLLQVEASSELYFGEQLRSEAERSVGLLNIEQSQHFSMELYEGRIASMQRFVAMTVML